MRELTRGVREDVEAAREDRPLTDLFVTMLQRLGVETDTFAGAKGQLAEV